LVLDDGDEKESNQESVDVHSEQDTCNQLAKEINLDEKKKSRKYVELETKAQDWLMSGVIESDCIYDRVFMRLCEEIVHKFNYPKTASIDEQLTNIGLHCIASQTHSLSRQSLISVISTILISTNFAHFSDAPRFSD
jgi:hypothetical protein